MPQEFDAIAATLDQLAAAWKTNEGAALARWFTDDGTLVNPFGERADGQTEVASMYSTYFGGMLRGTTASFRLLNVRAIDASHAFVDAEQTIAKADGGVVLEVRLAALFRRGPEGWRILDARPYTVAAPPA